MEIIKNEMRKGEITSDNSDVFAKWGSRNPELTISEEIDNQLASNPTKACVDIYNRPDNFSTIITYNDGITPNHERMETMKFIGKSYTDNRGASVCGVGQIGGLIAGRKLTNANGKLTFSSTHNGQESRFVCNANGSTYKLSTENSGPFETMEKDRVEKTYEGMRGFNEDQIKDIKLLAGVKIYPYAKEHPEFVFKMNGEQIKPISVLYEGVEDKSIQRMPITEFKVQYYGKDYIVKVGAVDVSNYVKPNGTSIDFTHANEWDARHNLSQNSCGVFVELGGSMVICGGIESWKLIHKNSHTTLNGIYVFISIPSDGDLKKAIFAESPNKSTISIPFSEINDNEHFVFSEILTVLDKVITSFLKNKKTAQNGENVISKEEVDKCYEELLNDKDTRYLFLSWMSRLNDKQVNIISNRQIKTVFRDIYIREKINSEVKKQCYAT